MGDDAGLAVPSETFKRASLKKRCQSVYPRLTCSRFVAILKMPPVAARALILRRVSSSLSDAPIDCGVNPVVSLWSLAELGRPIDCGFKPVVDNRSVVLRLSTGR
jgi:hypothetical protein